MKSSSAFVLFVFYALTLQSQKTFADRISNYTWVYTYYEMRNVYSHNNSIIDTTTTIYNGKKYYSFENIKIADSGTKVFGWNGTKEHLLMDYSLELGDTLKTDYDSRTLLLKLIEKEKVKIENDSLWCIKLNVLNIGNGCPPLTWIESLGCISHYHPINCTLLAGYADVGYDLDCIVNADSSILKEFGKNCGLDESLINTNKKWYTWASEDNGDRKYSAPYYFTEKDTIIGANQYAIMNTNTRIRYDQISHKYYLVSNKNNEEILIYKEFGKIGDTVHDIGWMADTIVNIELKWIGDDFRKVYTTTHDQYISGIGSLNKVFWDHHIVSFPEYRAGNICYAEYEAIKYHYNDYYSLKTCDLKSSIIEKSIHPIQIFPNPFSDIIYSDVTDLKTYSIYDLVGKVVMKGAFKDKLDVKNLSKGYYQIIINWRDKDFIFKIFKI